MARLIECLSSHSVGLNCAEDRNDYQKSSQQHVGVTSQWIPASRRAGLPKSIANQIERKVAPSCSPNEPARIIGLFCRRWLQGGPYPPPRLLQRLRQHPTLSRNRHEIGVSDPARKHVHV